MKPSISLAVAAVAAAFLGACITIPGIPTDTASALRMNAEKSRASCEAGNVTQCSSVAWAYERGSSLPQDLAQAERFYLLGCRSGSTQGCDALTRFAVKYREGDRDVPADRAKALALFEHACSVNDAFGCAAAGELQESGEAGAKNEKLALSNYKRACDKGQAWACARIGVRYLNGDGMPRDTALAAKALSQACDGEELEGCHNFGRMLRDGIEVPRDDARAFQLFTLSCTHNYAKRNDACTDLGDLHAAGRGTPMDKAKGFELWQRACYGGGIAGSPVACKKAASAAEKGEGVERNETRDVTAVGLYREGCAYGDKPSCESERRICKRMGNPPRLCR